MNFTYLFRCVFFLCFMLLYEAFPQNIKKVKASQKTTSGYIIPKVYAQRKTPEQFLKDQLGQKIELKERSTADQVIPDDLIVQSSLCVGFDCVDAENFGFTTIRLKENNTRIGFDDTSLGAFPANDWELEANPSASGAASHFALNDVTNATVPFKVIAGAPTNSFHVSSIGRIGLHNDNPLLDLHMTTSNTPALRFEQNSSGGFSAQTWDMAGNEANFFIRDVTSGSRLPFRIRPGAPTSSIDISAAGNVGIGTASASKKLHVSLNSSTEKPVIRLENANLTNKGTWDLGADSTFTITTFSPSDTTNPFTIEHDAPDNSFYLAKSGTIYVKGAILPSSLLTPSDTRLKQDIKLMGSVGTIINALQPSTFAYKQDKITSLGLPKGLQYGLIAQEVEKVLPSFVTRTSFPGQKESFKTVNYIGLVPILLQGMKEQIAINEQQQTEIERLKTKISQYEALNARLERLESMLNKEEQDKKADKK